MCPGGGAEAAAAEGRASKEIAAELGCNHNTVGKWRGRFARRGFDGLHDEPRPGKPRSYQATDGIERAGARPVFVDIRADDYCMDPRAIPAADGSWRDSYEPAQAASQVPVCSSAKARSNLPRIACSAAT